MGSTQRPRTPGDFISSACTQRSWRCNYDFPPSTLSIRSLLHTQVAQDFPARTYTATTGIRRKCNHLRNPRAIASRNAHCKLIDMQQWLRIECAWTLWCFWMYQPTVIAQRLAHTHSHTRPHTLTYTKAVECPGQTKAAPASFMCSFLLCSVTLKWICSMLNILYEIMDVSEHTRVPSCVCTCVCV